MPTDPCHRLGESDFHHSGPGYRLGEPGDPVVHAGPRQEPRIISVATPHAQHLIELVAGEDLFDSLTGLLDSCEVPGLVVDFLDGEFASLSYVHPAYGPDAAHPMSFTSELSLEGPASLHRASATVGVRDGTPFGHIHASWIAADGVTRGGHLLPGTLVGPSGMRLRVFALAEARLVSELDEETGFSAFAPTPVGTPATTGTSVAIGTSAAIGAPAATEAAADAIISRVRPGELIDEVILATRRKAGFATAEVCASLGSTVGAVFTAGTAGWPAVEFTHLTGTVTDGLGEHPRVHLEAEVVDVAGQVHAGVLAERANPVAVTFELFVRRA
ncbi:MAG: DNA-binding protein [Brevibacterium sp.]|nr:DNA-binding protein [Brevibacterium sp.]